MAANIGLTNDEIKTLRSNMAGTCREVGRDQTDPKVVLIGTREIVGIKKTRQTDGEVEYHVAYFGSGAIDSTPLSHTVCKSWGGMVKTIYNYLID